MAAVLRNFEVPVSGAPSDGRDGGMFDPMVAV